MVSKTMQRSCAVLAGVVAGLGLVTLIGCMTTEETSQPGALPKAKLGVTPRLHASTYMAHGHLLERQGSYARAAEQYEKALEQMPQFVEARVRLGITLNKLGRHDEATAEFRRALLLEPDRASVQNNLGFSLYLEGKLTEAEAVLARALELQPDFRRARMNHGLVLAKLGRYDEALVDFALAGSQAEAHYNLAVVQADAGEYAAAARSLEAALSADPEFEAAREQLHQISRLAAAQEAEQLAEQQQAELELARQLELEAIEAETFAATELPEVDAQDSELRMAANVEPGRVVGPPQPVLGPQQAAEVWEQIEALLAIADQNYAPVMDAGRVVAAIDAWIEAWILDAPWYESALCQVEQYVGPITPWP